MEYVIHYNSNSCEWCVMGRKVGADYWTQFGRWYKSRGWAERKRAEIERNYSEQLRSRGEKIAGGYFFCSVFVRVLVELWEKSAITIDLY